MHLAHPILAPFAIATLPAGGDLLRDGGVAQGQAILFTGAGAQCHHRANKFMARDHWRLRIANAMVVTPKERRAQIALQVAGTDPH